MSSLQELKKRLKSIRSTGEMASAMRTVATVKYSKVNNTRTSFVEFSSSCYSILGMLSKEDFFTQKELKDDRECIVFMSSNKGFCGGFNSEVCRKFDEEYEKLSAPPLVICLGKKGERHLISKGIEFETLELNDVPSYEDAKSLAGKLLDLYIEGKCRCVCFISMTCENMLTQRPVKRQILPYPKSHSDEVTSEVIYLPDENAVGDSLAMLCLCSRIFEIMLENATGAQAATIVAMKSACDNAEKASQNLETMINRRRQAEVTNSVIETSSASAFEGEF